MTAFQEVKVDIDDVELYCLIGRFLTTDSLKKRRNNGHFEEKVNEVISFYIYNGKSIIFEFNYLEKKKYSCIKTSLLVDSYIHTLVESNSDTLITCNDRDYCAFLMKRIRLYLLNEKPNLVHSWNSISKVDSTPLLGEAEPAGDRA